MQKFDNTRPEFSPYGFTCEQWTPARMPRPDRHSEIEVNLLRSGSLTYLFGGHRTTIAAGRLALFWAAIPHQLVAFEGDSPYFVVTLPLSEFLRTELELDMVNRVLRGEILLDSTTDPCDELKFQQWEHDLRMKDAANERAARLEVQARLLRLASGLSKHPTAPKSAPDLSRADQLACYIARNYHLPITAQSIADANGVHPNYAMTLFRQSFGTTMTTFVTQHRISHAQRLLVTTDEAILNIELDAGFQSLNRFNEAFKAACGCSPRDYRKAHCSVE
jgi:AraC-like DNA-binding protein